MSWQSLVTTAARLMVMGLLVFSQTSAGGIKSANQKKHSKARSVRPLITRSLTRELTAGTANPASLVQLGSTVPFNATLKFSNLRHNVQFPSVLSSDGTVLAIGFSPYSASVNDKENRVYVYRLLNPNTNQAKWVQTAYFTRARPSNNLLRGSVALSGDGNVLALGTGNFSSGSVMVYRFQSNQWVPLGSVSPNPSAGWYFPEFFGTSLALSFNGSILAVYTDVDRRLGFFGWNGTVWRQRGSPITSVSRTFSMSQDGNTVAVKDDVFDATSLFLSIKTYQYSASAGGRWVQFGKMITFGKDIDIYSISLSGNGKRLAALAIPPVSFYTTASKSMLRVFEFDTNNKDWISVGPGVTQTLVSDSYYDDPVVSLSSDGSLVAELRGETSYYCSGEVRVFKVTKNETWPQIYKYDGPYIRSMTGISTALSGDGKTLVVADFGFETYRVNSN